MLTWGRLHIRRDLYGPSLTIKRPEAAVAETLHRASGTLAQLSLEEGLCGV